MAPLPFSLSPHVCILSSPDLDSLLASSSLPPLPQVLQSFSPLPNVTTRTTSLTSVSHFSFTLRFSDLLEIETGCKEDEEVRASRTIDWIGARIAKRSAKWVEDTDRIKMGESLGRTPWWDELRRCTEGDHIPSKIEGWNHPVAIVLAVSTTAPNPLQAITALHSRPIEFPSWVDSTHIKYTLIVHPQNSPLSDEEAGALFNAVKKQFGLHTYLLPLALPSPPPAPIPVPALPPRLPPPPSPDVTLTPPAPPLTGPFSSPPTPAPGAMGSSLSTQAISIAFAVDGKAIEEEKGRPEGNVLRMHEKDIQMTARFVREFLNMSLVPWMEKCVLEWNENYTSTRRLPSRLFSSTRRLFGSTTSSYTPTHTSTPSGSSTTSRTSISSVTGGGNSVASPPPQQRRLAEFATMLGDIKLSVGVFESLRKEGKGGSEILPLLLAPSPALALHAEHSLNTLHPPTPELPSHVQVRALIYTVRWAVGIGLKDFLSHSLEGERWLVSAAGSAEEPHAALLLAHAAFLSTLKRAKRRAALRYLYAANRLEKCGIRPLTMYFLRRAQDLYEAPPDKNLSPILWDSENRSPAEWEGFDAIKPGIEHALGRLLYTTGDIEGAIRYFLDLLRRSSTYYVSPLPVMTNGKATDPDTSLSNTDKIFMEDFRVAFKYVLATTGEPPKLADLKLPFAFCLPRQTRVRLPSSSVDGQKGVWESRETEWETFWKERLERSGKAAVDETFWIDLVLQNPLEVEVTLSNLTIVAREERPDDPEPAEEYLETEVIDDVLLGPKETRSIPLSMKSSRPASLLISHATYDFLSLLPATDSLATRGRRLQETTVQRQSKMYAPDVLVKVEVEDAAQRLMVNFVEDARLVLAQGECKRMKLWLSNGGTRDIGELWMVAGADDEIWVDAPGAAESSKELSPTIEILHSHNSLAPRRPYRIPLETVKDSSVLAPGESLELDIVFHAEKLSGEDLCLLFVFRETTGQPFHSARVCRRYEVQPIFKISTISRPSRARDHLFLFNVEVDNVSSCNDVHLKQVTTLSPTWKCSPIAAEQALGPISANQVTRLHFGVDRWDEGGSEETLQFVHRKLADILHNRSIEPSAPPPINLVCHHVSKNDAQSVEDPWLKHLVLSERRNVVARSTVSSHPYVPPSSHPFVFPLYNPSSVDVLVFWEIPTQQRAGHVLVSGLTLGAGHAALKELIEGAENAKVKRSMYAETHRERAQVLEAIRASEWNAEMNPVVVTVQDGERIEHDFDKGACVASVVFTLRNYSLTHPSRFVLKLASAKMPYPPSPDLLPPHYSGRLSHRGVLQPVQQVTVQAKMWITRPGVYALGGWQLETEVGEKLSIEQGDLDAWRTRHRYIAGPSLGDRSCLIVTNVKRK